MYLLTLFLYKLYLLYCNDSKLWTTVIYNAALQYFVKYKLAPVSPPGGDNATYTNTSSSASVYQVYFLNALGFVAQIPNILLSGVNVFCQTKG